jgi:hypothetical protein
MYSTENMLRIADAAKDQVIDDINTILVQKSISRRKFAASLKKSPQYVSQALNIYNNFTLERLAEFACALDAELVVRIQVPKDRKV